MGGGGFLGSTLYNIYSKTDTTIQNQIKAFQTKFRIENLFQCIKSIAI